MKKIIVLIVALVTTFTVNTFAQTLKVTAVDASDTKVYEKLTKALGQSLTMSFYDNSVTLNMKGQEALNLKKISDTKYYKSINTGATTETFILTVTKVFGVVSAITLDFTGKKREVSNWATLTAKRF